MQINIWYDYSKDLRLLHAAIANQTNYYRATCKNKGVLLRTLKHMVDMYWSIDLERFSDRVHEDMGFMPKQKSRYNNDVVFAPITVSGKDKDKFEAWADEIGSHFWDAYADLITQGWKASVTWDDDNDCFIGSLTQRSDADVNYNVCVTSRSDKLHEALALTVYKIVVMYANKPLPRERPSQTWG